MARRAAVALLGVWAATAPALAGGPPFGNPARLGPLGFPVVATDPAGIASVAWIDSGGNDALLYCRSWDGGGTWSPPVSLAGGSGRELDLATAGTWVAAWVGDAGDVQVARSPDRGHGWEGAQTLGADGHGLRIATDGQGTWAAAWVTHVAPADQVVVARSSDDGVSWTLAPVFTAPAGTHLEPGRIASDGARTWLLAWRQGATGTEGITVARSVDRADTWAIDVLPIASPESGPLELGADGGGRWLLAWTRSKGGLDYPYVVPDVTAVVSRSSDDGRTWTVAAPIDARSPHRTVGLFTGLFDRDVQLSREAAGRWLAVWNSTSMFQAVERFSDVLVARSTNGGLTWTTPERLNATLDDPDRSHIGPRVATDVDGRTIVAWSSNDRLRGGIGPEDPFGVLVTRSVGCAPAPLAGCEVAAASSATLALDRGDEARFRWSWRAFAATDYGDPRRTDDYVFCLYGADGGTPPIFESALPAGGFCGLRPCWRAAGRSGFLYRGARGFPARPDRARLRTAAGAARIAVAGAGTHVMTGAVPFPSLSATLPVRVQLQSGARCWESRHGSAEINTTTHFSSRSD